MSFNIKQEIDKCTKNAEAKLSDAEDLANKGSYGTASSLLVTSFEERCKAFTLQMIELGLPLGNINDIQYIFTQHDFRHYIGFFVECLNEIMTDFDKCLILIKKVNSREELLELVLKPENVDVIKRWLPEKIDSFIKKIDFYRNIETRRQKGLYVDIYNGITPTQTSKQDYENIKLKLNSIHWISSHLSIIIEAEWWNKGAEKRSFLQYSKARESLPEQVQETIIIVKKKRSKLFQIISRKLTSFKNELVDNKEWDQFVDVSIPQLKAELNTNRIKKLGLDK